MKTQKICFLQYDLRGGGAERKVCTLANFFASQGMKVEIGLYGSSQIAYKLNPEVKVTFIRRESYKYRNALEKRIFCLKRSIQDIVVCNVVSLVEGVNNKTHILPKKIASVSSVRSHFEAQNNYYEPFRRFIDVHEDYIFITMMHDCFTKVHKLYGKEINNPYIVMECNNPKYNASKEKDADRNKYYPKASRCVAMTRGIQDYFSEEIQKKFVIIPNPVRNDLPDPFEGERRKTIVNFCRLNVQKNLPLLIAAFEMLHRDYPEYKLEIYGEGELHDSLIELIKIKNLEDCIYINDFDPNIHEKIKDSAMYVSSSNWEGFPNSVLEALSIGLPVISTDCDFGPRDMIIDHENGLLVPVEDAKAMYMAMKELIDNPDLADKISENAILTREKFSVEKIGNMWIDLLEEVVKE